MAEKAALPLGLQPCKHRLGLRADNLGLLQAVRLLHDADPFDRFLLLSPLTPGMEVTLEGGIAASESGTLGGIGAATVATLVVCRSVG